MTDEPDTTSEDVTDNVELSEDDTSEDFDYFDPDEDTEVVEEPEETDDEADEVEAQDAGEDQEAEDDEDPDSVTVALEDGSQIALSELKKGYLRQNDYSRKTQETANLRKSLEADVERMQRITDAFVDFTAKQIPDEPDVSLAFSDPAKYTAQKAQYDAAIVGLQKLMEMAETPKSISDGISKADREAKARDANQRLIEMFPEARSGEGRKRFMETVADTASNLGFTNEELSGLTDPRIFALAHWASKGMAAEKARATAKAKVQKAPPATPRKPGQGAREADRNAAAMKKLMKSGSIHDAMKIDFE